MTDSPPLKVVIDLHEIEKLLSDTRYVVVGVTGHRDLFPAHEGDIKEKIRLKLAEIRKAHKGQTLRLVTALAPGADQWVAQCLEAGDELIVVDTMSADDAKQDTFKGYGEAFAYYSRPRDNVKRIRLYGTFTGTFTSEQRNQQYVKLGELLVLYCDHLLALWDGVDGGGLGGTSDVVRMWVKGKGLNGRQVACKAAAQKLHQLVLPRQQNHIPLGRRFDPSQMHLPSGEKYEWVLTTKPAPEKIPLWKQGYEWAAGQISWLGIGGLLFGLLLLVDVLTGFQGRDAFTLVVLLVIYLFAWWAYYRFPYARPLLLKFMYPIVIASLVLVLGTIGFSFAHEKISIGNAFFSAANLITFDSSVFDFPVPSPTDTDKEVVVFRSNAFLESARILGGFLAGYAFILAFSLAIGKEGVSRLHFWWFRTFLSGEFTVVIGDGAMALDVVLDLERCKKRVAMLDEGRNEKVEELLKTRRVWYFKGNLTSYASLQKTFFHKAEEVFVMSDSDEENFRIAQEMDNAHLMKKQWYIHLHDLRLRGLLHQLLRKSTASKIRTFSVYENMARRLLMRYPLDRFDEQGDRKGVRVILLGFGTLAREIALTCIRMGQYPYGRYLTVKVYYPVQEQTLVDQFITEHPELFKNGGPFALAGPAQAVRDYTFQEVLPKHEVPIQFDLLPLAESELRAPDFSLYGLIEPTHVVSVYACLSSGVESARVLATLLPRIQWLKQGKNGNPTPTSQTDVQAFCHYNFPDQDEEEYLETRLNASAPYVPVFCFGNFIHECSIKAIRNEEMDRIARRLALLYACLYRDDSIAGKFPELAVFGEQAKAIQEAYEEREGTNRPR